MKFQPDPEVYVSTDVETDGPIPGPHSMLSLGSVAYDASANEIGSFTLNLNELLEAKGHPDTMAWWAERPEAFAATRTNLVAPTEAMADYVRWVETLPGKPIFVGYPASFDFMFVYWYLLRFTNRSPFGHSALDIRSYAMGALACSFQETTMGRLRPRTSKPTAILSHVALDDARVQGQFFAQLTRTRAREK